MTTIRLFDGDLSGHEIKVRCDLTQAAAPIQVDYCNRPDQNWDATQYQCADCRHRMEELAEIGMVLAARAVEMRSEDFHCEWEEID